MTVLQRTSDTLEKTSRLAAKFTAVAVVVLAAIMIGSLLLQVVFRYFIGQALSWSAEVALLSFVWITLLTGSLGVREAFHVRLTLAIGWLPAPWALRLERVVLLLIAVFGLILADSGARYVEMTTGSVSPAIGYPIELLHVAAPVAGLLIVLHALARLPAGLSPGDAKTAGPIA